MLLVYDFSPPVDAWWHSFYERYPPPAHEGRELDPEILGRLALGFRSVCHRTFEIGLDLTAEFYLDYVMTETNVAAAIRSGAAAAQIRSWCAETLAPLWSGRTREARFPGYYVWLQAR
jgi:hypothetical protein